MCPPARNLNRSGLGPFKEHPKCHVVSIRVSDAEKALLEEISRRDGGSLTDLMRHALAVYVSFREIAPGKTTPTRDTEVARVRKAMGTPFTVGGEVPRPFP